MIKRALISVYDKTGIEEFAGNLVNLGFEIISTGGTFSLLSEKKIKVTSVEEITGFPELLNGRVKTLHPNIFAGILCDRTDKIHLDELAKKKIKPIDIVAVNLYPFEKTTARAGITIEEAIEQIDIGGVSLLRAAAKNFKDVFVISEPAQYKDFIEKLNSGNEITYDYSLELALKAFGTTSRYDNLIQNYFKKIISKKENNGKKYFSGLEAMSLRYGENPHQKAVLYKENFDELFEVLHGKDLSYNNLLDIDSAYSLISEFKDGNPACAIIKHGNPSGAAVSEDLETAYSKAFGTDTLSPFGGIIIFNKKLDFKTSLDIDKLFSEIILAPDFDDDALGLLKKKKNRRLIKFKFAEEDFEFRKITGGILFQERNNFEVSKEDLKIVTNRKASAGEIEDMLFAFKIVKHTKSNAIVFVRNKRTIAIGGGQPSRIDSTKIAISKAREFGNDLSGSVAASDAFFPFPDGLIEIAKAGASCVIQPGGSVKDEDVIKAADEFDLVMAFTNIRHFKH